MHYPTTSLTPQTSRPPIAARHGDGRLCSSPGECNRLHYQPKRRGDDVSLTVRQTGGRHALSVAERRAARAGR